MGPVLAKRSKIKIENILNEKDADFDIICFNIDIDEFYPTHVCLWL